MTSPADPEWRLYRWRTVALTVAAATAIMALPIFKAQWHGEDELGVYSTATWLTEALSSGDWPTALRVLVGSFHPPGRYLMATVSFALLNPSVVALRVPTYGMWVATCVLAAAVAHRLAGLWAGLIAGLLLGASGLFSLEALGFGHDLATWWVLLTVWLKVKHPLWHLDGRPGIRAYLLGGACLAAGFLWFTSLLPVAITYHVIYGWSAWAKPTSWRHYVKLTLPFVLFYLLYYLVFLGGPYLALQLGIRDRPVGQLHQYLGRLEALSVNAESLKENLGVLNWYHLPFGSWFLLAAGIVWQWRLSRRLFWLVTPYAALFSFYVVANTGQHFLSYYIWLVPFAVAGVWSWCARRSRDWQGVAVTVLGTACVAAAIFGYVAHGRSYTEAAYPYRLERLVKGTPKWRTNLVRPLPAIADDLKQRLGPADGWAVTIDGPLAQYYFPDARYADLTVNEAIYEAGPCLELVGDPAVRAQVKAVVHSRAQPPLCDVASERVLTYPESFLEVVIVAPPP